MTRVVTGIPYGMWNCVVHTRLEPETADRQIQDTIAYFRSRDLPMDWYVGPATTPADLGERLKAQGLVHEADVPGMAADLTELNEDSPLPLRLEVHRVEDVGTLKSFLQILATVFAFPESSQTRVFDVESSCGLGPNSPYRRYVGLLEGKPVATSAVYLLAGVAGVYWVATLPDERGKGIGSAMTLLPLQEARSSGYRVGILHSSSNALGVYHRLGFEEFCKIGVYAWEPVKQNTYHAKSEP
jgi:GNAT superfamily N-acetyltransferase